MTDCELCLQVISDGQESMAVYLEQVHSKCGLEFWNRVRDGLCGICGKKRNGLDGHVHIECDGTVPTGYAGPE